MEKPSNDRRRGQPPLADLDQMVSSDETLQQMERHYSWSKVNFQPWEPLSEDDREEQRVFQELLSRRAGATIGRNCFISTGAQILTGSFKLGDNSTIAAGAIIRGQISMGANCTVNPFAHIAGIVRLGTGVRVAGLVSIYGFNHGYTRTDVPIWQQPGTYTGITVGDGVWIGANSVLVDGIEVGAHCIVAGGAVVTKSFPDYSIIAGNPAKVVRNRKQEQTDDGAI